MKICNAGVAIGAGRQSMVAYVNICSYYVVGVPLGILLGYVGKMEVKVYIQTISTIEVKQINLISSFDFSQGIWIGMIIGVATQTIALGYITSRTDWEEQVMKMNNKRGRRREIENIG